MDGALVENLNSPNPCIYEPQAHGARKVFYTIVSILQYEKIPPKQDSRTDRKKSIGTDDWKRVS